MNPLQRAIAILLRPGQEWDVIRHESGEPAFLFLRYVAILAAIPAICGFIGASLIGVTTSVGTIRVSIPIGLLSAVVSYFFSFVIVYLVALIVDWLAPYFEGERFFADALKLSVYSFTPAWLAGVFLLVPGLRFLTILGLYGFYPLWIGLPPMMRAPRERALLYALAVVASAILITFLLAIAQSAIATLPRRF